MVAVHFLIWAYVVYLGRAIVFPSEKEKDSGRVVIGSKTDMKGWRFIASIQEVEGGRVGVGMLISARNTLTTCGCIKSILYENQYALPGPGIERIELVAGTLDVTKFSSGMWRRVSDVVMHPHCSNKSIYFPMSGHTFDYGIVQADEPFDFSQGHIVRLRLPTWNPSAFEDVILNEILVKRTCTVAGWGYTVITFPTEYLEPSSVLLTTEVQLEEWQACAEAVCPKHEPHCYSAVLLTGKLCAKPIGKGNPCKGDIGAPLVCNGFVIAIFSTVRSCGEYNEPNYYARLDIAVPWISKFFDGHNEAAILISSPHRLLITAFLVVPGSFFSRILKCYFN